MINAMDLTSKRQSESEVDSLSSVGSKIITHLGDTEKAEVADIETTNGQEKQPQVHAIGFELCLTKTVPYLLFCYYVLTIFFLYLICYI